MGRMRTHDTATHARGPTTADRCRFYSLQTPITARHALGESGPRMGSDRTMHSRTGWFGSGAAAGPSGKRQMGTGGKTTAASGVEASGSDSRSMQHGCGPSAGWLQSWQQAESSAAIARWAPMKQTRKGVAAAGSIIPKQASSQMAIGVRNFRMRMNLTNQRRKQAANSRKFRTESCFLRFSRRFLT
jgi:hypothetical protein